MRRSVLTRRGILLAAPAILLFSPLGHHARAQDEGKWQEDIVRGRVIIRLTSAASLSDVQQMLDRHEATITRSLSRPDGPRDYEVTCRVNQEADLDAELVASGLVEFAHPIVQPINSMYPNDPSYSPLIDDEWIDCIKAPLVWDRFHMDNFSAWPPVIDIDTGVMGTYNAGTGKYTSTHPDMGPISHFYNAATGTEDVTDANGHGTEVMGVMLALTNNNRATPNVGWGGGNGIVIKIGSSTDFIAGINWIIANITPPGFINSSQVYGSFPGQSLLDAVIAAYNAGFLVCGGSGNNNLTHAENGIGDVPAPYALCVTACRSYTAPFARAAYASYGPAAQAGGSGVNACAPGGDTVGPLDVFNFLKNDGSYGGGSGTSLSTPLVTGIARFLSTIAPQLSIAHIRSILIDQSLAQATTGFGVSPIKCIDFDAVTTYVQERAPVGFR